MPRPETRKKKTHTKPEKSNNKMRAAIKERAAASCNPNDRSSNKSTAGWTCVCVCAAQRRHIVQYCILNNFPLALSLVRRHLMWPSRRVPALNMFVQGFSRRMIFSYRELCSNNRQTSLDHRPKKSLWFKFCWWWCLVDFEMFLGQNRNGEIMRTLKYGPI